MSSGTDTSIEVPQCPSCQGPMIFSMCLREKEWVCFPCGRGAEFFSGLPKVTITQAEHDALRDEYKRDSHALTELQRSGECVKPEACPLGFTHPIPRDYQFEFFGKGRAAHEAAGRAE